MNPLVDDYGFEEDIDENYDFQPDSDVNENKSNNNDILQSAASFSAHGLGSVVALPGNIRDLVYQTGEQARNLRDKFYSSLGMKYDDDFLKNDSIKNFEESIKAPFSFLSDKLPNSEDVNKFIDSAFEGYLAPKSEKQKLANSISEDIVNSMLNRNPKNLIRNFLIPAGANAVKKVAELFGLDPSSQETLKMLSWIGADMASISNTRQMLQNRFSQTRRLSSPNDMIQVNPRDLRFLDQLQQDLQSGGTRPSTTAALAKINEMRTAMQHGQISAREMLDFYRSINENLSNFGAFDVAGSSKPSHVRSLSRVQDLTRNMLNRYGRNQNPRFLQSFRENNLAWAAMEQSNNIAAFVKKNYTKPIVSDMAKGIFANATGKGIAVATGLTALERAQSFIRRLENPILRQYYGDVLRNSINNNRAGMIKSLSNFDRVAQQIENTL